MKRQDEAISALLRLPALTLTELGRALSEGTLRRGFSHQSLHSFVGNEAILVDQALKNLQTLGLSLTGTALLCEGLGRALAARDSEERSVQLVLSGPEVSGTPVVDTRTTVSSLFEEAEEEVMVSSYVFHEAAEFFHRLAEKSDNIPGFRVIFLLDLSHRKKSLLDPAPLISGPFAAEFLHKHWPGKRAPELWHDPRGFAADSETGGVMHAKTVIVDRKTVFVTSANFTSAGQSRNIEVGVLIRNARTAKRLHGYFSGLIRLNVLRRIL